MSKKKKKEISTRSAEQKALNFLANNSESSYSLKQISRKINFLNKASRKILYEALENLIKVGKVEVHQDYYQYANSYSSSSKESNSKTKKWSEDDHVGIIDFVNPSFAYVVSEDFESDVKIKATKLAGALDGDTVSFTVTDRNRKTGRAEGEVIDILKRKKDEFVGTFEASKGFAFVVPDSKRMFYDIYIPEEKKGNAMNGDKVIAKIIQYPKGDKNPMGKVTKVLGESGDNDVEMHAILLEYGLPYDFPADVEREAAKIPQEITDEEVKKRRDLRKTTTFTIDPHDAKDFDDAISVQKLANGNWEVGVHIADVTHYVRPNTDIEKEAYERATSVYLVDRTIPMLPEVLSNNLCSLRPHEDKLVFSAIFELDENAKVKKEWFGRCVIHSDRRFTYEEAQEVLETGEGDFKEELLLLNDLAKKLKKERFKKGAISFETEEVKFRLDSDGVPLEVIPKVRKDAHKLVEEFMLLANKKVAEFVFKSSKEDMENTMVYRVHDNPDPDKIEKFAVFASKFGYILNVHEGGIADKLNTLTQQTEGKPEGTILQNLAVRTMPKAKYTTESKGHFGLAFEHYSHFTSPIRRYPDMMAHRLLQHYLNGKKSPPALDYEEKCKHSSEMEKLAADAERSSIKYKQVEYIQNLEEKEFEGIVSGLTDWGIYVELLENKCEGMVRITTLEDDYYEFDPDNFAVVGRNNKKVISFGDPVKVKVVGTDLRNRTIDLVFIS